MTIKVMSEQQVINEAVTVLLDHLSPAQIARLWAAWPVDAGDYTSVRDQLFRDETVETLFLKIKAYEQETKG